MTSKNKISSRYFNSMASGNPLVVDVPMMKCTVQTIVKLMRHVVTNRKVLLNSPAFVLDVRKYLSRKAVLADVDSFTFVVVRGVDTASVVYDPVLHDPGVSCRGVPSVTPWNSS